MNQFENTQLVFERILAVKWELDSSCAASHSVLLQEHFRRMTLWAKALNYFNGWPFFDVAYQVKPSIRASAELVTQIKTHLASLGVGSSLMQAILEKALHWGALQDDMDIVHFSLPMPYEPILKVYERGGIFYISDNALIWVSNRVGFSQGSWRNFDRSDPYIVLDDEVLDQIDEEHNKKYPLYPR